MSIVVSGGKRGLTDPKIAEVILAAIPDQPMETQRKMNYFVTPRGRRLNEYEVLCCYTQPTPDWIPGGLDWGIGLKNFMVADHHGAMNQPKCTAPIGTNIATQHTVGTPCMLKTKLKNGVIPIDF